ncbi:MAG: putative lipid II flippase FtsW [Kiritimatiellae bacterium]|nr:putative lipid II flippase FtsW [Kiritimatiellia bacterium]
MRRTSRLLIASVLVLLSLGIVMLASTSNVRGVASFNDPYYFLKRQLVWLMISFVVGAGIVRFDYHWWHKLSVPLTAASLLLLGLVFVSGVGAKVGGSFRWIRLGPLSIQPSELAKFAVIVALSAWMVNIGPGARKLVSGVLLPVGGLGMVLLLLLLEPDFGTTLLVGVVGMVIMFVGGAKLGYLSIIGVLGVCGFVVAVAQNTVRLRRVLAFLFPDDPRYAAAAYHLAQSKTAFIRGELCGVGLGESIQKQFYLPEAHTDFILAIIGEELGFLVGLLVVIMFLAILVCGIVISMKAPDVFGQLLGFGFTIMITLQAGINIGVVSGCLPTKGLPLPFISYGGSSMMMSIVSISVLLNIAGHSGSGDPDDHTRLIKDCAHRL